MSKVDGLAELVLVGVMSLCLACSGDDGGSSTDSTDNTDGTDAVGSFVGGIFSLQTVGATDKCLDGALDEVFLPGGQPRDLPDNEVPGEADLPQPLTIDLNKPFTEMSVQVTSAGPGKMSFGDGAQAGILLDDDQWPGCKVDMDVVAALTLSSDTQISVAATLTLKNFDGDNCPVADADPCTVELDIAGTKK